MASNAAGRALFKRLTAGGDPSPVSLAYGEETFLVEQAVKAIAKAVLPNGGDDFSHQVFTGGEVTGVAVRQALETLSLFGGRRLIHVRNLDQVAAAELDALDGYAERPAPDTFLLLTGRTVDFRKRFFKALKKAKASEIIELKPLYSNELAGWVQRRGRSKGFAPLSQGVAQLIVDWTGPGLSAMDSALDKLLLYSDKGADDRPRTLTEDDVRGLLEDTRTRNVFELTKRLGKRQLPESVDAIERMMERGDSAVGMVSMVARHFRIVSRVREGLSRGLRQRALASHAGCPPMFVGEYEADARRFETGRLHSALTAIHDADRALKSSSLADDLIMAQLAMAICLD